MKAKKTIITICILVVVSVLLEVFLFNLSFWKFKNLTADKVMLSDVIYSQNVNLSGEKLEVDFNDEDAVIGIPIQEASAKTVGIYVNGKENALSHAFGSPYAVTPRYTVYTNHIPVVIDELDENGNVLQSNTSYVNLNSSRAQVYEIKKGNVASYIRLSFLQDEYLSMEEPYVVESLTINERRPFSFSIVRCFLALFAMITIVAFRPKSILWSVDVKKMKWISWAILGVVTVFFVLIGTKNPAWWSGSCFVDSYGELTKSLAKGQTYIDIQPDASLLNMDNPYDYEERIEKNVDFLLDYAYFEGKYYVYFGVFPALLFLPYYLLTGKMISYTFVFYVVLILLLVGINRFVKEYARRYKYEYSIAEFNLLFLLLVVLADIPYLFYCGYNYVFPQLFGMLFLCWGINFYLMTGEGNKRAGRNIFLGSLCIALIAACRPQLVLGAVLAIPLLKDKMCKKGTLKLWVLFILPYVIVAVPLMLYNYVRFGSPFDFGVKYNLTLGEIYDFQFSLRGLWEGVRYYFFAPLQMSTAFPWFNYHIPFEGQATVTEITAGYFVRYPWVCLLIGTLFMQRKKRQESMLQTMTLGLSIVMVAVASFYLGVRYVFDFAFIMGLFAFVSYNKIKSTGKYVLIARAMLGVCVICGIGIGILYFFGDYINMSSLNCFNRDYWVRISQLVEFWKN